MCIRDRLTVIWQNFFGQDCQPEFHFKVIESFESLKDLCENSWPELIERLAQAIPSSRGWLAEAKYQVCEDKLQLILNNELGWSYLVSRGLKDRLEQLLEKEYNLTTQVTVTLEETSLADDCLLEEQLRELENNYREKLAESLENGAKEEKTKGPFTGPIVVMGKKFEGKPRPLKQVIEEENNVIVAGQIFDLEYRSLKTGRTLVTFCITDNTDSLACKIIADAQDSDSLQQKLLEQNYYVLKGTVQIDRSVSYTHLDVYKRQVLDRARGIEVGQVFKLGTKYSEALGATYVDENGKENLIVMGCYGIGVSRTMAAAVEQNNDENGIIWPLSIAPYQVIVVPVSVNDQSIWQEAMKIYEELLEAGVEVVIDDRDERAGVKFKDADLIGFPLRITVGKKTLETGQVELKCRQEKETRFIARNQIIEYISSIIKE